MDPYRGEEVVLQLQRDLFRWNGPKAGFLLFGTVLGTVVITSRRFLFLSTGEGGFAGQFTVLGEHMRMAFGETRADELDLSTLSNKGSIELPLERVRSLDTKRRWDFASYLSLRAVSETGDEIAYSFMSKIGLNADELRKVTAAFEQARTVLVGA